MNQLRERKKKGVLKPGGVGGTCNETQRRGRRRKKGTEKCVGEKTKERERTKKQRGGKNAAWLVACAANEPSPKKGKKVRDRKESGGKGGGLKKP